MKLIKRTQNEQHVYNNGTKETRVTYASYEVQTDDGQPIGNAEISDIGQLKISINNQDGRAESGMAIVEQLFEHTSNNINE